MAIVLAEIGDIVEHEGERWRVKEVIVSHESLSDTEYKIVPLIENCEEFSKAVYSSECVHNVCKCKEGGCHK